MSDDVVLTLDKGCVNLGNLCAQAGVAGLGDVWSQHMVGGSGPQRWNWLQQLPLNCSTVQLLAFLTRVCGDEGLKSLHSEALALLFALRFWEACAIVDARITVLAEDVARDAATSKRYHSKAIWQ